MKVGECAFSFLPPLQHPPPGAARLYICVCACMCDSDPPFPSVCLYILVDVSCDAQTILQFILKSFWYILRPTYSTYFVI